MALLRATDVNKTRSFATILRGAASHFLQYVRCRLHIVLGGTGHTGSAVVRALLKHGQSVTVITHDAQKAPAVRRIGALPEVLDIGDVDALRRVLKTGERLFLLNPPAPPSTDTDQVERRSVNGILTAIADSGIKKVVAQSTYGAQPGHHLGDLAVLYEMEQGLAQLHVHTVLMRAAYLLSNWLMSVQAVREKGLLPTFFPPEFSLPMVAPEDLGNVAAQLMMQPLEEDGMLHVEGPQRYTARDVAQAFSRLLNKEVVLQVVAREEWFKTYTMLGFSQEAAHSYMNMTKATLEGTFPEPEAARRGDTSLTNYLSGVLTLAA